MNTELIKLFNVALEEPLVADVKALQRQAMQCGYLIHPNVCTDSVEQFIKSLTVNYNSTFYKRWQDVVEKSRFELFIDQIIHYASTYGTDFSFDNGFVPNDGAEQVPLKEYKIIMPIAADELAKKCLDMLYSGIALNQSTMQACADMVIDFYGVKGIDIDMVSNREAQVYICDKLHIAPKEKFALFRYIIFKTTSKTLIIKNKDLVYRIRHSASPFDFSILDEQQLSALSSIFFRFKPLFLAFKPHFDSKRVMIRTDNAIIINRLRKMADFHHKPMNRLFWADVVNTRPNLEIVKNRLNEIGLFKVVSLMQLCKERLLEIGQTNACGRIYVVRNGKMFLRNDVKSDIDYEVYLTDLYALLENYLITRLSQKACVTRFPTDYRLALPTTEKSFVGNMPFGTQYVLSNNNFIGIYWRNEWGTHDFDLSVVDIKGRKYGWNAAYYEKKGGKSDIIYSGDMTNAAPEASEVMYFRKGCAVGVVYVNRYNGKKGSKYKMYFGQEKIAHLKKNYMVNPNNVKLTVDMESDSVQQTVGLIFDNTITLMSLGQGNSRVADYDDVFLNCLIRKTKSFIDLEYILRKAGFRDPQTLIADDGSEKQEDITLDLTNLDRATLIQLLS